MSGYRAGSGWNDKNELLCLLIVLQLKEGGTARGRQADLCKALSAKTGLERSTITAKVGNFKSLAGISGPSNASIKSKEMFEKYGALTSKELTQVIDSMEN